MSDPISGQIAQQAANQAANQNAQQQMPQGEVNANDQARFEDALGQAEQTNNVEQTNQAEQANSAEQVDPAKNDPSLNNQGDPTKVNNADALPPSLGEAILDSVQRMRASHDAKASSIEQKLVGNGNKEMSMKDCIQLQFEVMQMSLEQDLTGKIADKTSNGVQTLFRNQ
ncbi:hypothetical protein GC197_08965 [bacterium]|nr:hypothetical protein [bacterium]